MIRLFFLRLMTTVQTNNHPTPSDSTGFLFPIPQRRPMTPPSTQWTARERRGTVRRVRTCPRMSLDSGISRIADNARRSVDRTLFFCLSLSLSVSLPLFLSVSVYLCMSLSVYVSLFLCVCLSISLCLALFLDLSVCLTLSLSLSVSLCL